MCVCVCVCVMFPNFSEVKEDKWKPWSYTWTFQRVPNFTSPLGFIWHPLEGAVLVDSFFTNLQAFFLGQNRTIRALELMKFQLENKGDETDTVDTLMFHSLFWWYIPFVTGYFPGNESISRLGKKENHLQNCHFVGIFFSFPGGYLAKQIHDMPVIWMRSICLLGWNKSRWLCVF